MTVDLLPLEACPLCVGARYVDLSASPLDPAYIVPCPICSDTCTACGDPTDKPPVCPECRADETAAVAWREGR